MNKVRTRVVSSATVLVLGASLVACTSSGGGGESSAPAEAGLSTVAFANFTDNSPLFAAVADSVKSAAEIAGAEAFLFDNEASAERTVENAQLMVQADPDVIIEYSPDAAIGNALFAAFDRAGIPCIALNIPVEGCPWLNIINENLGTAAGEIFSDFALANGWDGSNTTILLLNDPLSGPDVNNTVRYTYVTIANTVEGFTALEPEEFTESTTRIAANAIVADGGTSLDSAFAAVQSALQNIPADQNIIFSATNDDKALGGWRAISEAGRADTSVVVGQGGAASALQELRDNPQWIGEIDALLAVWGYYAVAMAAAIADGATPPELTELPFVPLTKENLADYYADDLGLPLALPEPVVSNEYLWGRGILESYAP